MKVYTGQIKESIDVTKTGRLLVLSEDKGLVDVFYTSPFGGNFSPEGKAGFFAIPEVDSWILFLSSDSRPYEYYYLSTIHKNLSIEKSSENRAIVNDRVEQGHLPPGLYSDAKPSHLIIQDRKGNKIRLNHKDDPTQDSSTGIDLISRDKKKLLISDTPKAYGIYLLNKEGDGITIASEYRDGYSAGPKIAPRQIDINTAGPVKITSRKSSIKMMVKSGQDINIRNESVGMNNLIPPPLIASPIATLEPYGNIRVSSDVRDVYITAGDGHKFMQLTLGQAVWSPFIHRSRVMLRAQGERGLVQIMSDGSIIIRAPNDNVYIHGGSVHIKAEQELNMESKGNVNIAAGLSLKMSSNMVALAPEGLRPPFFATDIEESIYDQGLYATTLVDVPTPTTFGHIEMLDGVTINGTRIDLAPIVPTLRARKATHPLWELGDYDGIPE